ncbi:DUF6355 family natural product biosynthesis protein [Nonomuraea sp. NPDC049480]|uniref:DUF6355 family natural product biosynthesis protein n=1 Tax=Nonomuraea sp. NPDC049480 TaxID=3364353 RepID=UPI00378C2C89
MRFATPTIAKSAIVALVAATVALAGTPVSASTIADSETTAQIRCGYYRDATGNWYGHCDEGPRTDIIIRVESYTEGHYEMCVKPGLTKLDAFAYYAVYVGRLCNAG